MPKKPLTIMKERDVRIHAILRHTSGCLLTRGQEQEGASFHQFMASLAFTAFTLEAYLNWIGGQLFPHWAYLERLSPKEKLMLVADQLKVKINNGERPWQTITQLLRFRNDIAHGKPATITEEVIEPIVEHVDQMFGQIVRTNWENFCTLGNAERAMEDVDKIVKRLHAAANLKDVCDPWFAGFQLQRTS